MDAPQAPARRLHAYLYRLGKALILLLHLRQQMDAVGEGVHVHGELHFLRRGLLRLFAAALHSQAVAIDDVPGGVGVLLGRIQQLAVLFGLTFGSRQLFPGSGKVAIQGSHTLAHLVDAGAQGAEGGALVGGLRQGDGLLRPQVFRRLGGTGGAVGHGAGLGQQSVDLVLQGGAFGVDDGDALLHLPDLGLHIPGPVYGVGHLGADAVNVLTVVLRRRLQHGDGTLLLGDAPIKVGGPAPQRFRLHVLLPHLLAQGLGLGVGVVQGPLGIFLVLPGGLHVLFQLDFGGFQRLQVFQPHADFQHPQFVPQHQVPLGHLRLLPQRLHLQLQLGDLVVDAHQVFLGALQLALRLLLAVAEFGDTGGLLEHLPALAGLDGQYLVDFALADDGITLPAHAGVHKQLVHVLEPAGLLVDVILALTAAVVPPGHRHFRLVPGGENVLGVVDDQRHLGKPHLAALLGTAEDDILHLGAPELAAVLLAHDPADGVGDIGLAGAVGAHDGGDVLAEVQHGFLREGLKSLDFQGLDIHAFHLNCRCILNP